MVKWRQVLGNNGLMYEKIEGKKPNLIVLKYVKRGLKALRSQRENFKPMFI